MGTPPKYDDLHDDATELDERWAAPSASFLSPKKPTGTPPYRIGKPDLQRRLAEATRVFAYAAIGSAVMQIQDGTGWWELDLRAAFTAGFLPFLLVLRDYFADTTGVN